MAKVVRNPEGIDRQMMRHITAQMHQHFDGKAQAVIRRLNAEMAGQPTDEVLAALMSDMRAAGMEPNEPGLRKVAASISVGSCT